MCVFVMKSTFLT